MAAQGELPPTQGQKIENSEPEQKAVQLPAGDQTTTTLEGKGLEACSKQPITPIRRRQDGGASL